MRIFVLTVLLVGLNGLWAQHEIDEQAEVVVHESMVRVVDKKGNPILHLPQNAFSLYVDGQLQKITTFEEVKLRGLEIGKEKKKVEDMEISANNSGFFKKRTMLILVDSSTMSKRAFDKTMPQLAEFIRK